MNFILDDKKREEYKDVIEELTTLCPETIARKFPRANIQQAFVLDTVRKLVPDKDALILSVGSYEDTATEALEKIGYRNMITIDPATNGMDLDKFYQIIYLRDKKQFKCIFSTSVIEHVENDEQFIAQICEMLEVGGVAVLTCDFLNTYNPGDPKPGEDYRLYTKQDLMNRLPWIAQKYGCEKVTISDYDAEPDFEYSGVKYSFATLVFEKFRP